MDKSPLTRHERRRRQTRQRLIQAAVDLLLEHGYDDLSIQAITDRADLGRGTFYIHFKDREDVLWAAVKDLVLDLEQRAHSQFAAGGPSPAEYYGLVNIFTHGQENRDLYRAVLGSRGSAILTSRLQDLMAGIILTDIRAARSRPNTPATIPEDILAQSLTGILCRLLFWWLETPNEYTAEQMAEMTYRVVYRKAPTESYGSAKEID